MVQTGNLKESAYASMLEKIQHHELDSGQVYSERQMSAELGVSRTPFHAALLQLEKEGYIDVLPSRGFMLHQFTRQDVRRTFEVRGAVEFYCCSRLMRDLQDLDQGVKGRAESLMTQLKGALDQQKQIIDSDRDIVAFEKSDFAFHQQAVSYVANPEFDRLFESYMFWIENLAEQSLGHEGRMEAALGEHQAIFQALRSGSVEQLYQACMTHFSVPEALNLEDLEQR